MGLKELSEKRQVQVSIPKSARWAPGSTRECESLLDGVRLVLCGLTQQYNHSTYAHSGQGTGSQGNLGRRRRAPEYGGDAHLKERCLEVLRTSIYLSVCTHSGWGGPTLSVLSDPQDHPAKKAGLSPWMKKRWLRCLGTSPRTHSTQVGITQHFLRRVGENEA